MVVRLCCFVQPFKIFAKLVLFGVDFIKLPFIFEAEYLNIVIFNNCFQFHCPNCNLHLSKKLLFAPPMSKLTVVVCSVPAAPQASLLVVCSVLAAPQASLCALKGQPAHSPGQAKRHPGFYIDVVHVRPVRAKALIITTI